MSDDVHMTVRKYGVWVSFPLDTDGTPMYKGDRLIEVEPGKWMHPDGIELEKYLAEQMP